MLGFLRNRTFNIALNIAMGALLVYVGYDLYLRYAPIERKYCQEPLTERPTVLLLGASWCPYCRKATRFLQDEEVAFCELDIEKSSLGQELYQNTGAKGIPVFLIGDEVVYGMDSSAVKDLLSQR